uniref:Uncharacterized protein n=1 Tax=Panagrellus redivivus TaxID=6233 RepID=A0A7E4VJ65_PANRE
MRALTTQPEAAATGDATTLLSAFRCMDSITTQPSTLTTNAPTSTILPLAPRSPAEPIINWLSFPLVHYNQSSSQPRLSLSQSSDVSIEKR